jgi:hypothetical protein
VGEVRNVILGFESLPASGELRIHVTFIAHHFARVAFRVL